MKTRNYAPAMGPAAGVRVFLNNFFRILRLFTLILLSASEDLTVSGGGREREECEPCVPGWRPSAERDPGRACATLRSLCGKDSGRSGMGDWLSGRAPRSHRGGHWFDPSIAHPVSPPSPANPVSPTTVLPSTVLPSTVSPSTVSAQADSLRSPGSLPETPGAQGFSLLIVYATHGISGSRLGYSCDAE